MKEIVAAFSIVGVACLASSAALSAQPEWVDRRKQIVD
jgi:hypothetical protein